MQGIWETIRSTLGDDTLGHPLFFITAVMATVVTAGLAFSIADVALGRMTFTSAAKYLAITLPGYLAVFALIRWVPIGSGEVPERAPSVTTFLLGLAGCLVAGDFLSYWWHRLEHGSAAVFRNVHYVHHSVESPLTVWSGFYVHPIESGVVFSMFYVVPFVLDVHPMIFATYAAINTFVTMVTHCGYKLWGYPTWLFADTARHEPHHELKNPPNFCVLLTLSDRLFGTYLPADAATSSSSNLATTS